MTDKQKGFEITEKDIDIALRYLQLEKGEKEATHEDAIALLEDYKALAHMMAHEIVDDKDSKEIIEESKE